MPSFDTTLAFFMASVVLALAPGPDNLFVLVHAAQHGRRAGLLVVLGLCSGLLFHTAAVAFGLAALLAASATAFVVIKLAGAAYLLWLAYGAWNAPAMGAPQDGSVSLGARQTYLRGVVMNATNPKVAIFFLAFLPQFADPARGSVALQVCVLGAVFMLATLLVFGAIAWFAAGFGALLQRSARAQQALNRGAALLFAALAIRLATAER